MGKPQLKKVIKSKLKSSKELSAAEKLREELKYEIAEELSLKNKVTSLGWSSLTSEETGRIGGIMTKRKKEMKIPTNKEILENLEKDKILEKLKK